MTTQLPPTLQPSLSRRWRWLVLVVLVGCLGFAAAFEQPALRKILLRGLRPLGLIIPRLPLIQNEAVPPWARREAKCIAAESLREENEELRRLLQLPTRQRRALAAEVIVPPVRGGTSFLTINRGRRDGLNVGATVVAAGNIYVGKIVEIGEYTAQVELLYQPGHDVPARVAGTDITGVVSGRRGLGLILRSVPRDATLQVGQRIVTSAAGGVVVPDLFLGTISDVRQISQALFQEAVMQPAVNVNKLRVVQVILL
jgi:rod shape-determining protein MreC